MQVLYWGIKLAKFVFNASVFESAPLFAASIATTVTVFDAETLLLANIWSDRDGLTVKANPFTLDEAGVIDFYADAGRYNITAVNGPNSRTWNDYEITDPAAGGGGQVDTIAEGAGINVDSADPANPIVSSDFKTSTTAASYTLGSVNDKNWIDLTGIATIEITCPPESSIDLGSEFVHIISNFSIGSVTIVAGAGVTVIAPAGGTLVSLENSTIGIKKASHAADTYIVFGPTEAI